MTDEDVLDRKAAVRDTLNRAENGAVFSTEFLYDHARKPSHVEALAGLFKQYFDKVTVIVYVRDQIDHMPSLVSQRVKAGQKSWDKALLIDELGYRYDVICDMWAAQFDLVVRDYGRCKDVVSDFFQIIGKPVPHTNEPTNRSLGAKKLELMIKINRCAHPRFEAERRKVVAALEELDLVDERFKLPEKIAHELVERFAQSNAVFSKRYLGGQKLIRLDTTYANLGAQSVKV